MASLITLKSSIDRNDTLVRKVVRSYVEAIALAKKDPNLTYKALAKFAKVDDRKILKETYEAFVPKFAKVPLVTEGIVKAALAHNEQKFLKARTVEPRAFIENRYVEELEKEGLFKKLYRD